MSVTVEAGELPEPETHTRTFEVAVTTLVHLELPDAEQIAEAIVDAANYCKVEVT